MKLNFAKAVYCSGVSMWYIRFGSEHGIDVMIKAQSEDDAKNRAKLINKSLNRDLEKYNKRNK